MNPADASVLNWFTLVTLVVGLITIFIKIGTTQGRQEEKNIQFDKRQEDFEKRQDKQDEKIDAIYKDVNGIKIDVGIILDRVGGK